MSPAANTPSMLVIMVRKSILIVPQRVTVSSPVSNRLGRSSGSKPSAVITVSAASV